LLVLTQLQPLLSNEFELAYTPEPPTLMQRLTDDADLIRRKCGKPRGLRRVTWESTEGEREWVDHD
jgi:hypothetical protein